MAEYKQLSLKQAAQFDHTNNLKDKVTAWGLICRDRHDRNLSRKTRRQKKESK